MSALVQPTALQIVHYPHPTLLRPSKTVRRVDGSLVATVRRMFELMYAAKGIGLAANQVDLPLRLFIVNLAADPEKGQEHVLVNPVLSRPKGNEEGEEGCLSLPNLYAPVVRPKTIHVQAYTLDGKEINMQVEGLLARVIQHEFDHLDGIVFPQRMRPTVKMKCKEELEEFEQVFRRRQEQGEIPADEVIEERLQHWEQRYC